MSLTHDVPSCHVSPPFVEQCSPCAFRQSLSPLRIVRTPRRLLNPAQSPFIQTRWTGPMSSRGGGRQPCCSSTPSSSESSKSKYAWRKRVQQAKRILQFAGPALSIPLSDPTMQLMDTVIIGQVRTESTFLFAMVFIDVFATSVDTLTLLCELCSVPAPPSWQHWGPTWWSSTPLYTV